MPVTRTGYRIGVPYEGVYEQVFCTDDLKYGGSGEIDNGRIKARNEPMHGCDWSISLTLPGLSAIYLRYIPKKKPEATDVTPLEEKPKRTRKPKAESVEKPAAKKPARKAADKAPKAAGKADEKTDGTAEKPKRGGRRKASPDKA